MLRSSHLCSIYRVEILTVFLQIARLFIYFNFMGILRFQCARSLYCRCGVDTFLTEPLCAFRGSSRASIACLLSAISYFPIFLPPTADKSRSMLPQSHYVEVVLRSCCFLTFKLLTDRESVLRCYFPDFAASRGSNELGGKMRQTLLIWGFNAVLFEDVDAVPIHPQSRQSLKHVSITFLTLRTVTPVSATSVATIIRRDIPASVDSWQMACCSSGDKFLCCFSIAMYAAR